MPELPEVETTRRALAKAFNGRRIHTAIMRRSTLRWPIPHDLPQRLHNAHVQHCQRRGKYVLLYCVNLQYSGWLLIHLGMSGSLCEVPPNTPAGKHDHVDFDCGDVVLRYNDPRRFGAILWLDGGPDSLPASPLLDHLGVEPLQDSFTPQQLYALSRGVKQATKLWLLAGRAVVGVGNIYCSESLFCAGIHPAKPAGTLTLPQCLRLHAAIRKILQAAIEAGGTTLNDFVSGAHSEGYYQNQTLCYGRAGQPCKQCGNTIGLWLKNGKAVAGRATYLCKHCQKR